MKFARKAVVVLFVTLVFLVACDPLITVTPPSMSSLSSTEKATLLTETLFASTYSQMVKAEEEGPGYILQNEYFYSFKLDGTYEAAYNDVFGNNPTYITAGATLTLSYSIKDGNQHTSLSIEGSSGLSGTIEIATIFNPTTDTYSYSIDGTSFDATGVELPDFDELLGLPKTFLNVQFLNPVTGEVVHQCDLAYNISNYEVIEYTENFDNAEFDPLIYRQYATNGNISSFFDGFQLVAVNRTYTLDEMVSYIPPNYSAALVYIEDYNGIGKYDTPLRDDYDSDTDPWRFVGIITNQIDIGKVYDFVQIDSDETDDGVIEISQYDDIGGLVAGNARLRNVALEYITVEDGKDSVVETEYYDILIEFSLIRGENIDINFVSVSFVYGDKDVDIQIYDLIAGATYKKDVLEGKFLDPGVKTSLIGWSTEPDGQGTIYYVGGSIVIPEGGMTLYAVWEDSP